MAWVSPKVIAILDSLGENQLISKIPSMEQEEAEKAVDEAFGKHKKENVRTTSGDRAFGKKTDRNTFINDETGEENPLNDNGELVDDEFDSDEPDYDLDEDPLGKNIAAMANREDENDYKIYEDKIREEISKVKDKKSAEYVADLIDENTDAGYISDELSDELYSELDKMIDEHVSGMPLYNSKISKKEPNPMDEFSGPEKEGPSYAQLEEMDKAEKEKYANMKADMDKNADEMNIKLDIGGPDERGKYFVQDKDENRTYFNTREQAIEYSKRMSKPEDNKEWRLKPENLAVVQKLQEMGLDTSSMSEEDFEVAKDFLRRFGK